MFVVVIHLSYMVVNFHVLWSCLFTPRGARGPLLNFCPLTRKSRINSAPGNPMLWCDLRVKWVDVPLAKQEGTRFFYWIRGKSGDRNDHVVMRFWDEILGCPLRKTGALVVSASNF